MRLDDVYPAILTIVLIGIVLGVGIFILAELRTQIATTYTGSDVSVNVTNTPPTNTTTLSASTLDDYRLNTVTVVNATGGETIGETLYNFTAAGVITWADALALQGAGDQYVNISSGYFFDATGSPEESINDTLEGVGGFAGWLAIIIVVIAAAIVLGIVLKSFGRRSPGV